MFEGTVAHCIGIARDLQKHCLALRQGVEMPVGKPIIDYVTTCVDDKFNSVEVKLVPLPQHFDGEPPVRAALAVFDVAGKKRARIAVASGLNRCWQRFVVCKELMHLLIDREDDRTPDALVQLKSMVTPLKDPTAKLNSETFAALTALEYLLPWGMRPGAPTEADPTLAIATRFRLPRTWVDFFYGDMVGYRTVSDAYNAKLDQVPTGA